MHRKLTIPSRYKQKYQLLIVKDLFTKHGFLIHSQSNLNAETIYITNRNQMLFHTILRKEVAMHVLCLQFETTVLNQKGHPNLEQPSRYLLM